MTAEMQKKRGNQLFARIDIMLAGKGSKIIGWLPEKALDELKVIFEKTFDSYKLSNGSKLKCNIDFDESAAKNEGVLGMLYDGVNLAGRTDFNKDDIINGRIRGEQDIKNTPESEIEIVNDGDVKINKDLPVYMDFVKIFNCLPANEFYELEIKENADKMMNAAANKIIIDKREIMSAVNNQIQQKNEESVFLVITEKIINQLNELGGEYFA